MNPPNPNIPQMAAADVTLLFALMENLGFAYREHALKADVNTYISFKNLGDQIQPAITELVNGWRAAIPGHYVVIEYLKHGIKIKVKKEKPCKSKKPTKSSKTSSSQKPSKS